MTTKKTLVEYGKVSMKRVYCEECQADTFLRNGCTVCCGRYYAEPGGTKLGFKRECDSSTEKRYVHPAVKKEILESQHHRCFYCDSDLNGYAHKNGAVFKMSTVFDHVVPWAWLHNNAKNNIVAS